MSICLNECAVFTQGYFDPFGPPFVAYYNFSGNTILPILTENPWGFGITDIANTTDKLWVLINTSPTVIKEYNLSLCPISTTLSRTFTYTGFPQNFPVIGLEAINNNNLLSTGSANNGFVPVIRYNISTNNLVPTVLFNLPYGRKLAGDLIYVPSTPTGPKIITLTIGPGALDVAPRFISQFDVTTGVIEMDKNIPINLIFSPYGLFTKNNKIYIQDTNTSTVWNIGLNFPYPLSYVNQISYTGATSFGGGASNLAKCNTVSFKKQKPYISFPGIVSIDQIISCQDWENPTFAIPIYVQPEGLIIVDETRLFLNSLKTDPVQKGYWVSDGTQTYLIGDGGLIKEIQECDFKFDNVISFDPVGGIDTTVRLYSNNSAIRQYATVTGGYQNTSSGKYSFVGGGQNNTSSCYNSVVGGGFLNTSSGFCSGILGGSLNVANGEFSFIGGGKNNTASDSLSVVAGGTFNVSTCECSVVGGGENNTVNSLYGIIGGGLNNTSIADFSIVGGGCYNANLGSSSVVGGGNSNTSVSNFSVVAGGTRNQNYGTYATISGGICNKAYLDGVTIGGGSFNTAIKYNSVIAGGYGNTVSGYGSTVSGGYTNTVIGDCSFAISNNSVIMGDRIAVIGGSGITGTTDDTVYVPYLNIGNISTGTTVNSLGIDSNGLVIVGNDFTGNTPSLSEVISIGNETGSDIVMTNGTLIKSNLEFASLSVNDLSTISGEINMDVTKSGITSNSSFNLRSGGIVLTSSDDNNESQISVDNGQIYIYTNNNDSGSYVDLNNFRYNTSDVTITGNTSTNIMEILISPVEFRTTNVKIWCNAYDNDNLSGLTQEFTSGYLLSNDGSLQELSTDGPTINLNESTFPSSVTSELTYAGDTIIVSVQNNDVSDTSTIINWRCRARRSS